MRSLHAIPVVLAGALALGATSVPAAPDTAVDPANPPVKLFDIVPASSLQPGASLYFVDMDKAWALIGQGDVAPEDRTPTAEFARPGTYVVPATLFSSFAAQLDEQRAEVGFDFNHIRQSLEIGSPPQVITVATVTGTPDNIANAVTADPTWSPKLTQRTVGETTVYDWGDKIDMNGRGPMRPVGQGGQLAVTPLGSDGPGEGVMVARTTQHATMEAQLATTAATSVLRSGPLAPALQAVVGPDLLQLVALAAPDPGSPTALVSQNYSGIDGEPPGPAIAQLVYSSDTAAATAADDITTLLASGTSLATGRKVAELLPGATVSASGSIVTVTTASPEHFRVLVDAMMRRDLVFATPSATTP